MNEDGAAVAERAGEWEEFDRDLEPEVKDLLCEMMEAEASIPRAQREKFLLVRFMGGAFLHHPGMDRERKVLPQDLETLNYYGLLYVSYGSRETPQYSITPTGRRYYHHLRSDEDQRVERVEEVTFRYLNTDGFNERHVAAYACWKKADDLAWSEDAADRQSEIGHNCRDALVAFATGLVDRYDLEDVDHDPEKFLNRMGAVFASREVSEDVSEALYHLWEAARGLAMRQDHKERQKAGELGFEDGRRVVFLTAMALVEADRFLA